MSIKLYHYISFIVITLSIACQDAKKKSSKLDLNDEHKIPHLQFKPETKIETPKKKAVLIGKTDDPYNFKSFK